MTRRVRRGAAAGALFLGIAVVACGDPSTTPSLEVVASPRDADRIPVIVDTDLDHGDLVALAILLRDPLVDVQAITISGTGLVHCAGGLRVAHYVLEEFGATTIPVACGREDAGPDALPFPEDWRAAADAGFGMALGPAIEPAEDAATLLARAVEDSPSAPTLVALGPWTNIVDAFGADETLADRLAGIHAMGGTIDAPGNVIVEGHSGADGLEWNLAADPSAVAAVLGTDVPITMVPLDATDDVPVPSDLADQLATDHAAAGADLAFELLTLAPDRVGPGQQLWDELAALTVSDPDLVTWEDMDLSASVVDPAAGRLLRDDAGRAVTVAVAADREAVEAALLEALRRGDRRRTPFEPAG